MTAHREPEPSFYGVTDADRVAVCDASNTSFGRDTKTLSGVVNALSETYCATIGAGYMYITDQGQKRWWQQKLESARAKPQLSAEQKKHVLERLTAAEGLERFLHTKYVGQKRFSLEGGDSLIPLLDIVVRQSGLDKVKDIVIGMAHRGRLNVLVNTLGKSPRQPFDEFEGKFEHDNSLAHAGDVKYHLGFRADIQTPAGQSVNVQLTPNPSHLEVVDPVVSGFARGKADLLYAKDYDKVLPILIHGDSAIAGQGVVYELLQMSKLEGYTTGGTVHFVINNQIGFTTDFEDARSSN